MFYSFLRFFLKKTYRLYSQLMTFIHFKGNKVSYSSFRTHGIPFVNIEKGAKLSFGEDFSMNNGMAGNQIGYISPCIFVAKEKAQIKIGNHVGLSQTTIFAYADVTIDDYALLGGGVKIYTSDFHSLDYENRRNWIVDCKNKVSKPVHIEESAFVGAGTIILKGVTIGARSIIGAGSVVAKNIPADCIAGGNPCKVIKMNMRNETPEA